MPFHPSNTYTIEELNENLMDILDDVERKAQISLDGKIPYTLKDKVRDGKLYVEQGIIAGCAGGGFENICDAADILKGSSIGADAFTPVSYTHLFYWTWLYDRGTCSWVKSPCKRYVFNGTSCTHGTWYGGEENA